jgi:hypothetical protein
LFIEYPKRPAPYKPPDGSPDVVVTPNIESLALGEPNGSPTLLVLSSSNPGWAVPYLKSR